MISHFFYSTASTLNKPHPVLRTLALVGLLIGSTSVAAVAGDTALAAAEGAPPAGSQSVDESLASIQQSIDEKRSAVREIRNQLKQLDDTDEVEIEELKQKVEQIKLEIATLKDSFENVALGGINQSIFSEQPEEPMNWKDEIEEISRPIFSSLKELTAKPRLIDSLRRESEQLEARQEAIEAALGSLYLYQKKALPPAATESIKLLIADWEQRQKDTQQALSLITFKLTNLDAQATTWYATLSTTTTEFIRGRGLTLLLATISGLFIWLITKGILTLCWKFKARGQDDPDFSLAPLVYYVYRLVTGILVVMALLIVFYVRGDVLLLTLAMVALVGAALALRNTMPRYIAEIRLLLGIGPVRINERLVLDGVPFCVKSLSAYSQLCNPALDGLVRLPLNTMNSLVSRPANKETWFPSRRGDYVLLGDDTFAQVAYQSVEIVEVIVKNSPVQISTRDFIEQNIRNLSRQGFTISCLFGIDYEHQAICLDTVPDRFRLSILNRFDQAGMTNKVESVTVDFSAAAASSLDYRIIVVFKGSAANDFFPVQRLIQQACVETCNRENWVIPFNQITVHSATPGSGAELGVELSPERSIAGSVG